MKEETKDYHVDFGHWKINIPNIFSNLPHEVQEAVKLYCEQSGKIAQYFKLIQASEADFPQLFAQISQDKISTP